MTSKKKDWVSGSTCVYNVGYHVVWSTKYRKKVIVGEVESCINNSAASDRVLEQI
jgi:putative transposase